MARVLSPTGIPLVQAQTVQQPRADANAFGAQVGQAMQSAGGNMQSLGMAIGVLQEKRQHSEDQAYLDRADLELDMQYGKIAQDEQSKANSGAENMTDSVRQRMETETPGILGFVQQSEGLRPSAEAIKKAQHLAARRQHQHLTHAAVYENNERVRHLGEKLDGTLAMIATNGAQTGDLDNSIARAEQSIDAYKGLLPPAALDKMRQRAAAHFYEQMAANSDPEGMQSLMRRLTRGEPVQPGSQAPGASVLPPETAQAVDSAARATGVDARLLRAIVSIESGGDPRASVPSGKYQGLFQLSGEEFKKYGSGDIRNAQANALAGAQKIKAEIADFKARYGREPSASDIYLRHQQGTGGYDALVTNPDEPAWRALTNNTAEWRGNPEGAKEAIRGNLPSGMRDRADAMTAKDFVAFWGRRVGEHGAPHSAPAASGTVATDGSFQAEGLNIQPKFDREAPYGKSATSTAVPFKGIVVHSTGNDTSPAQDQISYGQRPDPFRGGAAFGYHFYIDKDGAIIQGAPMDKRTNHVLPMDAPERSSTGVALDNASAIGISFIGSEGRETPAQIEAFRKLSASLGQTYNFDPKSSTFGHGEIQGNKQQAEGARAVAALRAGPDVEYAPNPVMEENTLRGALARELSSKAPQIAKAVEKKREADLQQDHARRIMSGELPVDPSNKDDKEVIDNAFKSTGIAERLGKADPAAAAAVTAVVVSTGYVPEEAVSRLRALSTNGSDEDRAYAYETAANLLRVKPGAMEMSAKGKILREDAEAYAALTKDAGISPADAVKRIADSKTPEFEKRREAFKKQASDAAKKFTAADITKEFSSWKDVSSWFSSAAAGGSAAEGEMLLRTYRHLYTDAFSRSGDDTIAKAAAIADIKRTFAVTSITGNKRLMQYPPELNYPPIEPKPGATPDHSYFARQLGEAVKQVAGKEIPMADIYLESIAQTASDVRAGRPPAYGVVYITHDASGPKFHAVPGAFYADTKMEIERARHDRGQDAMADRQTAISRQNLMQAGKNAAYYGLREVGRRLAPDQAPPAAASVKGDKLIAPPEIIPPIPQKRPPVNRRVSTNGASPIEVP